MDPYNPDKSCSITLRSSDYPEDQHFQIMRVDPEIEMHDEELFYLENGHLADFFGSVHNRYSLLFSES